MLRKPRKTAGVIGLGIIGSRAAAGLRSAGYQTFVWNRTPQPTPNFLASAAEVAAATDLLQFFLADAAALFEVLESLRDKLTPSHVVISSGTIGPEGTLQAATLVREAGAQFLDAPFTGSKEAADRRQLVYYVGGEEQVFLRAKPVLEATSKAIVRIGAVGDASVVKVVTNMIAAVSIQSLAEGLAIVRKSGIADDVFAAALAQNACRSATMDLKLPKMVSGDFEPHFALKHMFKDVQLGIHMANALDLNCPASSVTAGALFGGIKQGWGDLDFSALWKTYEQVAARRPALPATALPDQAAPGNGDAPEQAPASAAADATAPAPAPDSAPSEGGREQKPELASKENS